MSWAQTMFCELLGTHLLVVKANGNISCCPNHVQCFARFDGQRGKTMVITQQCCCYFRGPLPAGSHPYNNCKYHKL